MCAFIFVLDLRWSNIQNLGEAFKLLQYGNKNRSAAATKMNQSSSRRQTVYICTSIFFTQCHSQKTHSCFPYSHSTFTMKLLKIDGSAVKWISE